jgi:hypothetical protein
VFALLDLTLQEALQIVNLIKSGSFCNCKFQRSFLLLTQLYLLVFLEEKFVKIIYFLDCLSRCCDSTLIELRRNGDILLLLLLDNCQRLISLGITNNFLIQVHFETTLLNLSMNFLVEVGSDLAVEELTTGVVLEYQFCSSCFMRNTTAIEPSMSACNTLQENLNCVLRRIAWWQFYIILNLEYFFGNSSEN